MLLTTLATQNFLGLPSMKVDFAPLTLICGANGSGKTSLLDAISFALTGQGPRGADRKADLETLLSHGADKGFVELTVSGRAIRRAVKNGELANKVALPPLPDALDWVLDSTLFTAQLPAERRKGLAKLLKSQTTAADVCARLTKAGCPDPVLKALTPYINKGFEAAEKQARTFASEARGAWKSITGQTYGSVIGEQWVSDTGSDAPAPEKVLEALNAKRAVEAEIAGLNQALGAASRQLSPERRAELETQVAKLAEQEAALTRGETLERELAASITELEKLATGNSGTTNLCPHCKAPVVIDGHTLRAPVESDTALQLQSHEALLTARAQVPVIAGKLVSLRDKLRTARAAQAELTAAGDAPAVDVSDLRAQLAAKADRLTNLTTLVNHHNSAAADAARTEGLTEKAAAEHANVVAYTEAANQLSPNGIPATLLAGLLNPVNEHLADVCAATGWGPITLDPEMVVHYGLTPFALASESQQWRVHAALAYTFAALAELKLLVLDRMDVLDLPSRNRLLGWLLALSKADWQVIVAATLKAAPDVPGVKAIWMAPAVSGAPA